MNFVVDAGNTATKLAVFDRGQLLFQKNAESGREAMEIKAICDRYPDMAHAIISNVGQLDRTVMAVLTVFCKVHQLGPASKKPFKNSYATPSTLGVDRMALAAAAFYHNPQGNSLVIDTGSCITYDTVNDYGEYLGGAISPGLAMRYKAMHRQTANLPLLEPQEPLDLIGNSTKNSMHSGVFLGMVKEIDGIIAEYHQRFKDLTVILTGGDAQFLSNRLKNTIFADSNFLLKGLNHLLEYNKQ
ncbi:MAG: type III pantothenate kinase [Bacteroidota bacterium]